MSHVVTLRHRVRDLAAVQAACQRLNSPPVQGKAGLFSGEASGVIVQLPVYWQYPDRLRYGHRPSAVRQFWRPLG